MLRLTATLLLLFLLPLDATAQTYRWVDETGRVQYTQVPPVGRKYEVVGPTPPASAAPNQDSLQRSLDESIKDEPKRREEAARATEQRAAREERCQKALERLAALDSATPRRLAITDENGQVARMSEEEFQKRRAETQQDINASCDG